MCFNLVCYGNPFCMTQSDVNNVNLPLGLELLPLPISIAYEDVIRFHDQFCQFISMAACLRKHLMNL